MDQEKAQEKYVEFKMINEQLQEAQSHMQMMEKHLMELAGTMEALDDLGKADVGSELFVPLSSGIFAKAKLEDNSVVNVNVGSGVAVSKPVKDAKKLIEEQTQELEKYRQKLMMQMHILESKAQEMQQELQGMMG